MSQPAAPVRSAPYSEEALRSLLQSVEARLVSVPDLSDLLLQRGYLLERLGRDSAA